LNGNFENIESLLGRVSTTCGSGWVNRRDQARL
jgi:hypothetical protein